MVATRSLQLTVKRAARSMKSLEGQLLMVKNGERIAVSSRVMELDQMIPQYLGVSRAVLDNVIFCHQDESLWPMSEPSVLKKKFDEIFEALKYTKAVENIKILRKKQGEELQRFKIMEEHTKEDKNKYDKAEKRACQLSDEISNMTKKTNELKDEMNDAARRAEEAWDRCSQFERIVAQLEGKRIEASAKQESVTELKQHIQEMSDSDEQLTSMLERYGERAELFQEETDACRQNYNQLAQEVGEARSKLSQAGNDEGRLQAQKDSFDREVLEREDLVKDIARSHSIRGFDHELHNRQVQDFMERILRMAKDQNAAMERTKKEMHQETQNVLQTLNQLNERKSALNQSKENVKTQMIRNEKRIADRQKDFDRVEANEGAKAMVETNIDDLNTRLSALKQKFEIDQWDKKARDAESKLRNLDESVTQFNSELFNATQYATSAAKADMLNTDLRVNLQGLQTMKTVNGNKLSTLLGDGWDSADLEDTFQKVVDERQRDLKEAEQQRDGTSRELEQTEFKLSTVKNDLNRKLKELAKCRELVINALGGEDPAEYLQVRQELDSNRDVLKSDAENFAHLTKYYGEALSIVRNNNMCRLCDRTFQGDREKSKVSAKLTKLLSNTAKDLVENELKDTETDLAAVREVGPNYDTWVRLSEVEVPKLQDDSKRTEAARESLLSRLEEQDKIVNSRQGAKRDVEACNKPVQDIMKHNNDIKRIQSQIDELQSLDSQARQSRGLEEIQEDLKRATLEARDIRSEQSKLLNDKESAKSFVSTLELELSKANAMLNTTMYQLKERKSISDQIDEAKNSNKLEKIKIGDIDHELQQLAPQIHESQVVLDDATRRADQREKEMQAESTRLANSINQLRLVDKTINAYLDRNGPQQLARVQREAEQYRQDIDRIEREQKRVTQTLNKVNEQARNHQDMKRSIADNLRYRRDSKALLAVQSQIVQLEAHDAEADRSKWQKEADRWTNQRSKLAGEVASLIGQMKSKDDQLAELIKAYETDYKDAGTNYKKAHINVETSKAAVEDLGRYGGALDKAIMKYHSLKMEEINRIIEELWKKTYQGTDVDSIMIRSENENDKGNKSYNYRVVFVKSDVEMDMRGRCSAGQKVLASIIIRLALAECFGINCGLIALDEPTTNLDADNIRSLAQSLHDIIKSRQQQSNFQLIVITHDEEFLRHMQCTDFSDYYYRVSRNQKQKSIIERQLIAEVM